MKVMDCEAKGNVIRLYYGEDGINDYYGDDWGDRPLSNCGLVYDRFTSGTADIAFPFTCAVLAPENDWKYGGDVPYSKEDFKQRTAPCLVVLPEDTVEAEWDPTYSRFIGSEQALRIYYGDGIDKVIAEAEKMGAVCFGKKNRELQQEGA